MSDRIRVLSSSTHTYACLVFFIMLKLRYGGLGLYSYSVCTVRLEGTGPAMGTRHSHAALRTAAPPCAHPAALTLPPKNLARAVELARGRYAMPMCDAIDSLDSDTASSSRVWAVHCVLFLLR